MSIIDLIKEITPRSFKDIIKREVRRHYSSNLEALERSIPKYEVSEKHITNLKVLPNRRKLIELLPQKGVVAELGVAEGDFSREILEHSTPRKLHLIDTWDSSRYSKSMRSEVERKFVKEIGQGNVAVHIGSSVEVGSTLPDYYFDWIYIDTDHSYETTKQELELYRRKVKVGGIIAGHDFTKGNWSGMIRYGVIEAVYEFCVKSDWEIIYLTMELNSNPSYALKVIA